MQHRVEEAARGAAAGQRRTDAEQAAARRGPDVFERRRPVGAELARQQRGG
jgi:hypothetical protein